MPLISMMMGSVKTAKTKEEEKMRYIMISEDGSLYKAVGVREEELLACIDGYLSILDMETLKEYFNGEWVDIGSWDDVPAGEN